MSFAYESFLPKWLRLAKIAPPADCFPQFPQLPTELRLAIWEQFALPKKLYHMVLQDKDQNTEVILSDAEGSRKRRDIRRIMQVNAEARGSVLNGHQLVVWKKTRDPQGHPQPSPAFSFVNWELDLFSVWFSDPPNGQFEKEPYNKIKNLAVGIVSTFGTYLVMPVSEETPFQYECHEKYFEWREVSGSVERVVLILPWNIVWLGMCIYPLAYQRRVVERYPDQECVFRDGRDLLMNEYGLHTIVDPTDDIYGACNPRLVTEVAEEEDGRAYTMTGVSFTRWVQEVVRCIARRQAISGRRAVECQIMLDYFGYRDRAAVFLRG